MASDEGMVQDHHQPPPARITIAQVTAEQEALYIWVPPPPEGGISPGVAGRGNQGGYPLHDKVKQGGGGHSFRICIGGGSYVLLFSYGSSHPQG